MSHAPTAAPLAAPRLAPGRRFSLSMMMFLEYAIWGAWFVVLNIYLEKNLGFSGTQVGSIYGTMALGTIFAPLFVGQIADRYFSSEKLMGWLHLAGAVLLVAWAECAKLNLPIAVFGLEVTTFHVMYVIALIYALLYSPTLVLSNSITFTHVPDGGRDFPRVRVFGTIGWIAAGLIVGQVLTRLIPGANATEKPLLLAAGFSAALGLFSFLLPHTPPPGKTGDAFPALRAVGLLRSPSFAVFFGVSFVITIVLAFYYTFTSVYLDAATLPSIAGLPKLPKEGLEYTINLGFRQIPIILNSETVMTIGQISEMCLLPFLPWFLRRLGMKWVLAMGMAAWGLRYLLFALGANGMVNPWVVVASLALHGVCFDFFFAAGFIYVDNEAPRDIRASGQALFTFLTYGVGMWLGSQLSGVVKDYYTSGAKDAPILDWYHIWLVPCVGVVASLIIFALFFRMERKPTV
jgi:nucleoside transporter